MTKTIGEVFRNSRMLGETKYTGEFGIEIETESARPYDAPKMKFWNSAADGSLRNYGIEYILKMPMNVAEIDEALAEFNVLTTKQKFITDSISTSVHVHVNMTTETPLTLANFVTAYTLMENMLIRISGPDRLSNLFCLPMKDAEGNVDNIEQVLKSFNRFQYRKTQINNDRAKYAALNMVPLTTLGSVEIRTFRGETDVASIKEWITIIKELKTFAQAPGLTPVKILGLYKDMGPEIVNEIFPATSHIVRGGLTLQQVDKLIIDDKREVNNLYYAAKFANCSDRWDENFGVPKPKKVVREKYNERLDAIAIEHFTVAYSELDYSKRIVVQELFTRLHPNVLVVDVEGDI